MTTQNYNPSPAEDLSFHYVCGRKKKRFQFLSMYAEMFRKKSTITLLILTCIYDIYIYVKKKTDGRQSLH